MEIKEESYTIELSGIKRDLPLARVAPGLRVALFNILGDSELVKAVTPNIAALVPDDTEVLLHPEGKGIPLVCALAAYMDLPYVVPRKTNKQWMLDPISTDVKSITTGKSEKYWMDRRELHKIEGKRVAIVDDVISTGSTLTAMEDLVAQTGGTVVARAAILTEGDERENVSTLGHLPLFFDEK